MKINTHLDVDMVAIEANDEVTVMLEFEAPPAPDSATPRPDQTVVVVLDRSGSMAGGRLEAAKRALIDLVGRLDDRDRFGLIVFDHQADVAIPAGRVGELGRDAIRRSIAAIGPGGSTDLSSGYLRGLQEARRAGSQAGSTLLLLSDGHANAGVTDPAQLRGVAAQAASAGVTTSTIGVGLGYDEAILAEVATGGTGNHSFAQNPDDAAAAVAAEVDGLLSKSVQAANLLIEPTGDVAAITIYNDVASHRVERGIMVELGDFYSGEQRRLTFGIEVPAMAALGLAQVATLIFTHVEVATLEQHVVTLPVSVNVVPGDVAAGRVPSPVVSQEKLFLAAQRAKKAVEEDLRSGDVSAARRSLANAAFILSAADLNDLGADLSAEMSWIQQTEGILTAAASGAPDDVAYAAKHVTSDRTRKARGFKTRTQGGVTRDDGTDS